MKTFGKLGNITLGISSDIIRQFWLHCVLWLDQSSTRKNTHGLLLSNKFLTTVSKNKCHIAISIFLVQNNMEFFYYSFTISVV